MIYRVQKKDLAKVRMVLVDAFQHDPLWNKIYEGETNLEKRFHALPEVFVRHCLKYGEVYAPSENLEGVLGWVPGNYADMTMRRMMISGAMSALIRIGLGVLMKMEVVFKPIEEDRRKHMARRAFIYLSFVGIAAELQGKGYGRKLIDAAIEKSEKEKLPLYLETELEENVKMYEHFGFKLLKKITLPIVDLPMWEMVRQPQG